MQGPRPQRSYRNNQTDGFVSKLSTAGAMIFSTYIGGTGLEWVDGIAVDADGDIFIAGESLSGFADIPFPTTPDAFAAGATGTWDGFLTVLNPAATAYKFSTLFHASLQSISVATDGNGSAYLTGRVYSGALPVTSDAFQHAAPDNDNAFVLRITTSTGNFDVSSFEPHAGGNTGQVTITIFGHGIQVGAAVALVCGNTPMVAAGIATVGDGGTFVRAPFDLHGAIPGQCTVRVTNADRTSATLQDVFTIAGGGSENIWVDLAGASTMRRSRHSTYLLTYGNAGSVDALGVILSVDGLPAGATITIDSGYRNPIGTATVDYSSVPLTTALDGAQSLPLYIPVIPAGTTKVVALGITLPATQFLSDFTLSASINRPLFHSPLSDKDAQCLTKLVQFAVGFVLDKVIEGECYGAIATSINAEMATQITLLGSTDRASSAPIAVDRHCHDSHQVCARARARWPRDIGGDRSVRINQTDQRGDCHSGRMQRDLCQSGRRHSQGKSCHFQRSKRQGWAERVRRPTLRERRPRPPLRDRIRERRQRNRRCARCARD